MNTLAKAMTPTSRYGNRNGGLPERQHDFMSAWRKYRRIVGLPAIRGVITPRTGMRNDLVSDWLATNNRDVSLFSSLCRVKCSAALALCAKMEKLRGIRRSLLFRSRLGASFLNYDKAR